MGDPVLRRYGRPAGPAGFPADHQRNQDPAHGHGDLLPGRVVRVDRGAVLVALPDRLEQVAIAPGQEPAAGDWVAVTAAEPPCLQQIGARSTQLVRLDPDGLGQQVLAANVDTTLIVCGLDRPVRPGRIERSLILAWESGADPVVALTKADLVDDAAGTGAVAAAAAAAPGVDVLLLSARTGQGLDGLRALLAGGRTVALLGESGSGKSTLVNALAGDGRAATGAVRAGDAKGRHTTTARTLIPAAGGVLLDTPGVRAVGLVGGADGMDRAFPQIAALAAGCRFADCAHEQEPGCAVQAAIADGALDPDRLQRWLRLQRELAHEQRKRDARARAEHDKTLGKLYRSVKNRPYRP